MTAGALRDLFARARRTVAADLRADPYLVGALLLVVALGGFDLAHRAPVPATWDERDRLLDALVAYGSVVADPSLAGLREGVGWGRVPFGGTGYLYAAVLLPVVLAALILEGPGTLAAFAAPAEEFGYYGLWTATPGWLWTASIVAVRLVSLAAAVGSVYLAYRLGTALRGRTTGRVAALLVAVTAELVVLSHEGGEDLPALCVSLLALYLLVRYVQRGAGWRFYAGSTAGGAALGLKLTAAPLVPVALAAHLLRRGRTGRWAGWWRAPRLYLGAGAGAAALLASFPDLLVGRVGAVVGRLLVGSGTRVVTAVGPDAPTWWWFLRGYAAALGWPLLVAVGLGTGATLVGLARGRADLRPGAGLVALALLSWLALFAPWHDFRPHHLLPTLPLLAVLGAATLAALRERHPQAGRVVLAIALVGGALYAGGTAASYADTPRERAGDWVREHVPPEATVETYQRGFEHLAAPGHARVSHPYGDGPDDEVRVACPDYVQLVSEDLFYLRAVPADARSRYVADRTGARAAYLQGLVNGSLGYEVVATFGGVPPDYAPDRPTPGSLAALLPVGLWPGADRYGDDQELRGRQAVVLLERVAPCTGEPRSPPW